MTEDWRSDFDVWLAALSHEMRVRICPTYRAGLIGPNVRESIQPRRHAPAMRAMISCTISSRVGSGMRRRWMQRTHKSAGTELG